MPDDLPTYAVRDPATGKIFSGLSWTNASEAVRLYGKEWVHNYDQVIEKAQTEAKANSNTNGNTRQKPAEAQLAEAAAEIASVEDGDTPPTDLSDMTREELLDVAAELGLVVDKRVGHAKLLDAIMKAKAEEQPIFGREEGDEG